MPFPSPGDLPDPGIKPTSLVSPALAAGVSTLRQGSPFVCQGSTLTEGQSLVFIPIEGHRLLNTTGGQRSKRTLKRCETQEAR